MTQSGGCEKPSWFPGQQPGNQSQNGGGEAGKLVQGTDNRIGHKPAPEGWPSETHFTPRGASTMTSVHTIRGPASCLGTAGTDALLSFAAWTSPHHAERLL